jgi:lysophospholipase L1-like esterase
MDQNHEPDMANVTLGASDVMRVIRRRHGEAKAAEAELVALIEQAEAAAIPEAALEPARRVLVEFPEPRGTTMLAIAPYWHERAPRATAQLERLRAVLAS